MIILSSSILWITHLSESDVDTCGKPNSYKYHISTNFWYTIKFSIVRETDLGIGNQLAKPPPPRGRAWLCLAGTNLSKLKATNFCYHNLHILKSFFFKIGNVANLCIIIVARINVLSLMDMSLNLLLTRWISLDKISLLVWKKEKKKRKHLYF